jgi:hypothetical protein
VRQSDADAMVHVRLGFADGYGWPEWFCCSFPHSSQTLRDSLSMRTDAGSDTTWKRILRGKKRSLCQDDSQRARGYLAVIEATMRQRGRECWFAASGPSLITQSRAQLNGSARKSLPVAIVPTLYTAKRVQKNQAGDKRCKPAGTGPVKNSHRKFLYQTR